MRYLHKQRLRTGAFAVLGLFVASLTLAHHHQATALHGFCSDHGEVIHLDDHHPAHAPHHNRSLHADLDVHGVHHCAVLVFLAQGWDDSTAAAGPMRRPRRGCDGVRPPPELPRPAIDPLNQSPKTSPPTS